MDLEFSLGSPWDISDYLLLLRVVVESGQYPRMNLLELNDDILISIFRYLTVSDLENVYSVSERLAELVDRYFFYRMTLGECNGTPWKSLFLTSAVAYLTRYRKRSFRIHSL